MNFKLTFFGLLSAFLTVSAHAADNVVLTCSDAQMKTLFLLKQGNPQFQNLFQDVTLNINGQDKPATILQAGSVGFILDNSRQTEISISNITEADLQEGLKDPETYQKATADIAAFEALVKKTDNVSTIQKIVIRDRNTQKQTTQIGLCQ